MAALVLGAVGGMLFGPIGFLAGSLIGNLLFPNKTEGPRLQNLKLQGSSYGNMIPLAYGTVRLAGQVVWETDLQQHKHSQGGKGGPNVTTYSYSASFAVKICKGPMGGVSRIWANGTIIYDTTGGSTPDNSKVPVTFYLGVESANPDPTMEGVLGVGNVPAFRDDMAAVFTDMDLSNYGNTIPQLNFEVFGAGGPVPWRYASFNPFSFQNVAGPQGTGPSNGFIEDGDLRMTVWTDTPPITGGSTIGFEIKTFDLQGTELADDARTGAAIPCLDAPQNTHFRACPNNAHIAFAYANGQDHFHPQAAYYYDENISYLFTTIDVMTDRGSSLTNPWWNVTNESVYMIAGNTTATILRYPAPGGAVSGDFNLLFSIDAQAGVDPSRYAAGHWTMSIDDLGRLWVHTDYNPGHDSDTAMFLLDADFNILHTWTQGQCPKDVATGTQSMLQTIDCGVWNDILLFADGTSANMSAYSISETTWLFTAESPGYLMDGGASAPFNSPIGNQIPLGNGLFLGSNGIASVSPQGGPVTLASIVSDLSVRAGLTTGQIDVTQLTDLVDGYIVSTQTDCRSDIEPLRSAYFFDGVESSGVVKFVKRGGASVVSIPQNDLAAQQTNEKPPPVVQVERAQEVDLPAQVNVTYMNKDAAYQNGSQLAMRQVTRSQAKASVELAIVMDDLKARGIASVLLFSAWQERTKLTFRTSRKYDYLEPTDIVTLPGGYQVRITRKMETVVGVLEFEGLSTFSALYLAAQAAAGTSGYTPVIPPTTQPTDALLLDIPLIVDTDFQWGFYWAAAGAVDTTWRGANLNISRDGGANYVNDATATIADSIGVTSDTLGNWTFGEQWDEINTVTVVLDAGAGTLASATADAVLNGANMALVGLELIQFRDATLIATRTYTLSGLLRGRRGTEFEAGTHTTGDRFVLMPVTDVNGPFSDLFRSYLYKAVTSGDTLADTLAITFENDGARARCYSPVLLAGGIDDLNDWVLSWVRRTRIGGDQWLNGIDAQLSETTEQYYVNIYAASFTSLKRQITVTGLETTIYLAADQVADFGSTQSTLYWGVQQIGALGPGIETRKTSATT